MLYDLNISEQNTKAHLDIEKDIAKQKEGIFTFTLRVNHGSIIDYTVTEYADAAKYLKLTEVIIQEFIVTSNPANGNSPDSLRTDHS